MRESVLALLTFVGTASVLGLVDGRAQQPTSAAATYLAAARAAATTPDAADMVNTLCNRVIPGLTDIDPPAGARARGRGAAGARGRGPAAGPPARDSWHADPVKLFDNLYYVGERANSIHAVTTSAGIFIINAAYDYSIEDEVVGGFRMLGLEPEDIKAVIITHAHVDHHGGALFLQDTFKTPVYISTEDWDFMFRTPGGRARPRRDQSLTDGQKVTIGDTTITAYLTPGHTPGTVSLLIPVEDNGQSHMAVEWGGAGFNFTPTPQAFRTYAASAKRMGDLAAAAGADVLLAPHPAQDGGNRKLPAMATRKAGDPNPYVVGPQAVQNYFTVMENCALYKAELAAAAPAAGSAPAAR
jgi:metallo-beta-lactamase class B